MMMIIIMIIIIVIIIIIMVIIIIIEEITQRYISPRKGEHIALNKIMSNLQMYT